MSKEIYNMPLQPTSKQKTGPTATPAQLTEMCRTFVNTLNTDEEHLCTENGENNTDLPCKRKND
jgi:hypothetical protein